MNFVVLVISTTAILLMLDCHNSRYILVHLDDTEIFDNDKQNAIDLIGARSKIKCVSPSPLNARFK